MKQVQSERVFLNMAGKESSQTVQLTLHLQDDVDGAVLKEAVEATRQRYPYHQVRLCTVNDEQGIAHYAFDDNPLHAILVEVSAAGGTFCISFMQLFTEDNYLNAFLDELHQQGIGYEIADRHKVMLAPIPDYRKNV